MIASSYGHLNLRSSDQESIWSCVCVIVWSCHMIIHGIFSRFSAVQPAG